MVSTPWINMVYPRGWDAQEGGLPMASLDGRMERRNQRTTWGYYQDHWPMSKPSAIQKFSWIVRPIKKTPLLVLIFLLTPFRVSFVQILLFFVPL